MPRIPVLLLFLAALSHRPAQAAESYDNCTGYVDALPAVISTQGTWCLRQDVSTAITSGAAITIATNNVTLDCNHFKVGGLAAGLNTFTSGVRADNRVNTVVRNCNFRGFYYGTYLDGFGHVLEKNRVESNTYVGLYIEGDQGTMRGNLVLDTGGSTLQPGAAFGIAANGSGLHVIDNTVEDVRPSAIDGTAYGIYIGASGPGSLAANRVGGLFSGTGGDVLGIWVNGNRYAIHGNVVNGPDGTASEVGILCTNDGLTAYQNLVAGFDEGITGCLLSGNVVNPN